MNLQTSRYFVFVAVIHNPILTAPCLSRVYASNNFRESKNSERPVEYLVTNFVAKPVGSWVKLGVMASSGIFPTASAIYLSLVISGRKEVVKHEAKIS